MADEPAAAPVDTPAADPGAAAGAPSPADAPALSSVLGDAAAATLDKPAADPAAPAAPVVPESYEFKAPDGFVADDTAVGAYKDLAKKIGLTQDQFSQLAELGLGQMKVATEAPAAAWQTMQDGWKAEVAADPDLGIVNGKLGPVAQQQVAAAAARFGSPELMTALAITGAGNHPAVIKLFTAIGKALGEAQPLDTGKPAPAQPRGNGFNEIAARLYPNHSAGA